MTKEEQCIKENERQQQIRDEIFESLYKIFDKHGVAQSNANYAFFLEPIRLLVLTDQLDQYMLRAVRAVIKDGV